MLCSRMPTRTLWSRRGRRPTAYNMRLKGPGWACTRGAVGVGAGESRACVGAGDGLTGIAGTRKEDEMRIEEHESAVLLQNIPDNRFVAGDVGTVVFVHEEGDEIAGYTLEFLSRLEAFGQLDRGARTREFSYPAERSGVYATSVREPSPSTFRSTNPTVVPSSWLTSTSSIRPSAYTVAMVPISPARTPSSGTSLGIATVCNSSNVCNFGATNIILPTVVGLTYPTTCTYLRRTMGRAVVR